MVDIDLYFSISSTTNLQKWIFEDSIISNRRFFAIRSVLLKDYWQKRGLILLFNHPKVTFTQLPDSPPEEHKELLTKSELLNCLNPVKICLVLEQENKEWLQFFVKEHFDKKVPLGYNPMQDEEFMGKLIQYKLAILNHSGTNDMQARYILPVNTLLSNLLKFPDKLERVKTVFEKTQTDFFESFEVFELLCYLEQYDKIGSDENSLLPKFKQLHISLAQLRAFRLNYFDPEQINVNLGALSQLYKHYQALKHEQ